MWAPFYRSYLNSQISLIRKIRSRLTLVSCSYNRTVILSEASTSTIMAGDPNIARYFKVAKNLTVEAGKYIAYVEEKDKDVKSKGDEADLVTNFDTKIEDFLIDGLCKEFPDHKFIGEETVARTKEMPELTDAPTWIIDPIDGTLNFVHSYPQYCTSVALAICKEIVIGIVHNPSNGELYTAVKGQGAFLNDKPIHASNVTEMKKGLFEFEPCLIAPYYKHRDIAIGRLVAIIERSQGMRNVGSPALSMAYVAKGVIDCYQMDGLGPWDVAAGMLIVQEAGGAVLDSKGDQYNFMKPNTVAASTCKLACEVVKLIIDTDLKIQRQRLKRT